MPPTKPNIIIYQRFLAKFRYGLFEELSERSDVASVKVVATKGMGIGSQKGFIPDENSEKLKIDIVSSISSVFKGKRIRFIPFYPHAFFKLRKYDVVVLEGTSNLLNDIFLVPIAWLLKKKIVWWDAGYNGETRTSKRKFIDAILRVFIKHTHAQMAYSSLAKEYMQQYMGAKNCFCNVNTISTLYFKSRRGKYSEAIENRIKTLPDSLNVLYVGSIEERKNLHLLIEQFRGIRKTISFVIIGDGMFKPELTSITPPPNVILIFKPASYDFSFLEDTYLKSHLFMMPGEGGLSIIQSMQFGLPVIAIKADGTEFDYITSNVDGYICSSIAEFREKIIDFLGSSPADLKRLYTNTLEKSLVINSDNWCEKFIEKIR
ncbi:MAG: glycosyltransferase [Bacteroidetes bacterium]|nr:glycosyltransferase [Bacteroidota bacterium]